MLKKMPSFEDPVWHDTQWLAELDVQFESFQRRTVTLTHDAPQHVFTEDVRVVGHYALAVAGIPLHTGVAAVYAPAGYTVQLLPERDSPFVVEYDVAVEDDASTVRSIIRDITSSVDRLFETVERRSITLNRDEPRYDITEHVVRIVGHPAISVAGIPCNASSTPYAMVGQSVILTDPGTDVLIVEYDVPV